MLAHPTYIDNMEREIEALVPTGLTGMEVYYKHYDAEQVEQLRRIAERLGLYPLGGSDYHAMQRANEREPGDIPLPDDVAEAFIEMGQGRPAGRRPP
ncbi:MAG: hypothetical protein U0531_07510 [Dehalococcoidia bacterium]